MRSRFSSIATVMRLGGVGALVVAGTIALSAGPAMAAPSGTAPMAYTCTGGAFNPADPPSSTFVSIPSGNYASITIAGVCNVVPGAVISVVGNVYVAAGGVFDAQSAPSTITVGQNVIASSGSLLGLGCLPNPPGHMTGHPCAVDPTESSTITVNGNVIATNANTVLLNGISVKGNVILVGSEGTASVTDRATAIPWAIKDNTIGSNLILSSMTPLWVGVLLNNVGGNVILTNINITDGLPPNNDTAPTIFVASNTVGQNLACWDLGPHLAGGFTGEVNVVGGKRIGQCDNLADIRL